MQEEREIVEPVTCNCVCACENAAEGTGPTPTLCMICGLMNALNSSKHGLPYAPPVYKPLEPLEPITNAQKDAAIQEFVAENGF